jgi:NAD(P)-dependent dehydrogenase (short-subunit alcohol dehydrogenase family)
MGVTFSQIYPPRPSLTEQNLPSQKGKVFIVTGGYSGVGYQLASMLFGAGGKVYIAGRSEAKAQQSIETIKLAVHDPASTGQLEYLPLSLDDLSSIKAAAEDFQSKESKLDVLWNNAGVSLPPVGSVSKQGHELHLATNCLGPFLFTQLLLPSLRAAAETSPPGSVRVVWAGSITVDTSAPQGGIRMADLTSPPRNQPRNYITSKTGNWFLASELAREVGPQGILSVAQNPGNLKTSILRDAAKWQRWAVSPFLFSAQMGAYTELWAGLSPELTMDANGCYIVPWGRIHPSPRKDLLEALKTVEEGGTGRAGEFRRWCEEQTAEFR